MPVFGAKGKGYLGLGKVILVGEGYPAEGLDEGGSRSVPVVLRSASRSCDRCGSYFSTLVGVIRVVEGH